MTPLVHNAFKTKLVVALDAPAYFAWLRQSGTPKHQCVYVNTENDLEGWGTNIEIIRLPGGLNNRTKTFAQKLKVLERSL